MRIDELVDAVLLGWLDTRELYAHSYPWVAPHDATVGIEIVLTAWYSEPDPNPL